MAEKLRPPVESGPIYRWLAHGWDARVWPSAGRVPCSKSNASGKGIPGENFLLPGWGGAEARGSHDLCLPWGGFPVSAYS